MRDYAKVIKINDTTSKIIRLLKDMPKSEVDAVLGNIQTMFYGDEDEKQQQDCDDYGDGFGFPPEDPVPYLEDGEYPEEDEDVIPSASVDAD